MHMSGICTKSIGGQVWSVLILYGVEALAEVSRNIDVLLSHGFHRLT